MLRHMISIIMQVVEIMFLSWEDLITATNCVEPQVYLNSSDSFGMFLANKGEAPPQ
jgi:hypothetical protein